MESVNNSSMTNVLTAVNVLLAPQAKNGWQSLNTSVSTMLLSSVENFAKLISFDTPNITIENQYVELRGQFVFNENGNKDFNETFFGTKGNVFIPEKQFKTFTNSSLVISIGFESLSYILQSESNSTSNFSTGTHVNSILLTVTTNENNSIIQPMLTFEKQNKSLNNLSCVFWDLNSMKWNESGCSGTSSTNSAICDCRHLTSFSILMSMNVPPNDEALEWITHIGLGISMGSLLLCLIIEILVWKIVTRNKTSYMRHVSIVNIALSLLIADIWFIIGGQVQNQKPACTAATFFTQFFYLSLFFWMFFMGLMLFYRLILIFHDMSQSTMMLIAFMLGYGCPLAITVITVAITEPNRNLYTGTNACWLNWKETKAILAFVIPAFFIIASNFIILFVVISRILKPSMGDRHRSQEKNTMIQVARSIAILTPLLGLTWGFGIAIVVGNSHYTFHIIFTVLNAFQGFFVLLFGTLMDSKVREALMKRIPLRNWSTQKTKTTFSAPSSGPVSRAFGIFNKRGFYSFTDPSHPSSSNYSESYSVLN
ncbi:adhesion G protein-coupled receptor F5-like [Protopterus annectens]|uniref:adhesion G protein-coupled receptor F5-like n=1 Tax=Protopterus annectens TaxID=7888 RepID=UPI001CF9364A|nr:adhesion G protein-coupled receptor F5-like [Protopterus annectens]